MKKDKKCAGCGIHLQTEDIKKDGYVPKDAYKARKKLICQRCFKIKNYGKHIPMSLSEEDYLREVKDVIEKVDIVVAIFDIIDFEGSFDRRLLDLIEDKRVIAVINKIDLIPSKKHPSEVSSWVKKRFIEENIFPDEIAIISVKQDYGVSGVLRKVKGYFPHGAKVGVVGVTNVGKSSLINGLYSNNSIKLTESKYPGTTLKKVKNRVKYTDVDFEIVDTPGLIPKGRISDMVCEECALKIVPSKEISRMTFKPENDRVLMLGGMVALRTLDNESEYGPIFSVFASKDVKFHETNMNKAEELMGKDNSVVSPPCSNCFDRYSSLPMKKEVVTLEEGEELAIKGLAWLSVKRGPLVMEVTLPEGGELVIRESFIVPKRV